MVRYISAGATQLLRRNYQGNYHFNIITNIECRKVHKTMLYHYD